MEIICTRMDGEVMLANILLIGFGVYLVVSFIFGLCFVLSSQDEHYNTLRLFLNARNLKYIFIIFPLITWALIIVMFLFYLGLGCLKVLDKADLQCNNIRIK